MTRLALTLAAPLLALPAQAQTCYQWPLESVYDGDTVRATVDGKSTPIRLLGLDTPELPPRHECEAEKLLGYAARDRLKALSQGAVVTFCPEGQDRYSYELHYGPIPEGKVILHLCDNLKCVNPAHLQAGTQKENVHDSMQKQRWMSARRREYLKRVNFQRDAGGKWLPK